MLIDELRLRLDEVAVAEVERIAAFQRAAETRAVRGELRNAAMGGAVHVVIGALRDGVDIPARRAEVRPVATQGVASEVVVAGVAVEMRDARGGGAVSKIEPGLVACAVGAFPPIDVTSRLHAEEVVAEIRTAAEDAQPVAIVLAVQADEAAPAFRR